MLDAASGVASKRAASSEFLWPNGKRLPVKRHPSPQPLGIRHAQSTLQARREKYVIPYGLRGGRFCPHPRPLGNVCVQPQKPTKGILPTIHKHNRQISRDYSARTAKYSADDSPGQIAQSTSSGRRSNPPHSTNALFHVSDDRVNHFPHQRTDIVSQSAWIHHPGLILQPHSSPISGEELEAEVKGIYAGLVMVEAKCIHIDTAQAHDLTSHLGAEQWQALTALHRTLLYEHHDFLMATQHPSATPALRGLAIKYNMPARMWRHGIHAFLDVLRRRRLESHDYMLAFIHLAYQMMALLYETVPAFLDTWIECLGDLARYRMVIEKEEENHAHWGSVAAHWYTMAADRRPEVGRLNHHLGILERSGLRKLSLYAKALTCAIPFPNARDSLAVLCGPIARDEKRTMKTVQSAEASIFAFHAMVIAEQDEGSIAAMSSNAVPLLAEMPTARLREIGAALAMVNVAGLLGFGSSTNGLWQKYVSRQEPGSGIEASTTIMSEHTVPDVKISAATFAMSDMRTIFYLRCFSSMIRSYDSRSAIWDLLPFAHVMLVHFHSLHRLHEHHPTDDPDLGSDAVSWTGLSDYLNALALHHPIEASLLDCAREKGFSIPPRKDDAKPLPEDYLLRGLIWTRGYFPSNHFVGHAADEDGRPLMEVEEMQNARAERVLWLGLYFACRTDHLGLDERKKRFFVPVST